MPNLQRIALLIILASATECWCQSNPLPSPQAQSFLDDSRTSAAEQIAPGTLPDFHLDAAPDGWHCVSSTPDAFWHLDGTARAYYINDQRIEFTGEEATFAVEGVLHGDVKYLLDDWTVRLHSELFLTEPFDRNILVDNPVRQSFAHNFEFDPLTISQLYLELTHDNWTFVAGKFETPFGRYYYPIYRNNFDDSPFIRSDVILYRETGVLAQWHPGNWSMVMGLTNGGLEQDTNSSKAFIGRVGYDSDDFALGVSLKGQDGIGSEGQKQFNEYAGLDAMRRWGKVQLSGEVIADGYGNWRDNLDPNDIFWGRSIYGRDVFNNNKPLVGVGWYANLNIDLAPRMLTLNYGDYFPQQIGLPQQDTPIHRALIKLSHFWTPGLQSYGVLLLENSRPSPLNSKQLSGVYFIVGLQLSI